MDEPSCTKPSLTRFWDSICTVTLEIGAVPSTFKIIFVFVIFHLRHCPDGSGTKIQTVSQSSTCLNQSGRYPSNLLVGRLALSFWRILQLSSLPIASYFRLSEQSDEIYNLYKVCYHIGGYGESLPCKHCCDECVNKCIRILQCGSRRIEVWRRYTLLWSLYSARYLNNNLVQRYEYVVLSFLFFLVRFCTRNFPGLETGMKAERGWMLGSAVFSLATIIHTTAMMHLSPRWSFVHEQTSFRTVIVGLQAYQKPEINLYTMIASLLLSLYDLVWYRIVQTFVWQWAHCKWNLKRREYWQHLECPTPRSQLTVKDSCVHAWSCPTLFRLLKIKTLLQCKFSCNMFACAETASIAQPLWNGVRFQFAISWHSAKLPAVPFQVRLGWWLHDDFVSTTKWCISLT